jgi:hypothetical protein
METMEFKKLVQIYSKYFSLGYLGTDASDKLALISLTCYVTKELQKKGKKINCYEVLLQIGKDFPELEKNTFLKAVGAICEDFLYGSEQFPDFGLKPSEMPKTIKKILDKYTPF